MATRRKPHDPAKAAVASLERRDRDEEAKRLEGMGATVSRDRSGAILSAYRSNVFNLLLSRGTITQNHHDAASQLANAWSTWKGLDGGPDHAGEKVDGSGGSRELINDRMIRAGKDVQWTLSQIGSDHRRLLEAFMVATVEEDRPMAWRGICERLGVAVRDRQTQLVVGALEELRGLYQDPRERAA